MRTKSFAKFCRTYLMAHGKSSIYDLYYEYKKVCETDIPPRIPIRYSSCRVIIYILRRFGVIKNAEKKDPRPTDTTGYKGYKIKHKRQFVELVPGQDDHPIWEDVWKYLKSQTGKGKDEEE